MSNRTSSRLSRTVLSAALFCTVAVSVCISALCVLLLLRSTAGVLIFFPNLILLLHLINRDTNPEYKLPWTILLLLLPLLGALLYLLFFSRKLTREERRHLSSMEVFHPTATYRTEHLDSLARKDSAAAGKALALLHADRIAAVYRHTTSRYFDDGSRMFDAMREDLLGARRYIFIEMFIIAPGAMWDTVHKILKDKVAQGVEVRLLYDDVGCMKTLPPSYDAVLRAEGMDVHRFSPVSPRLTVAHNHRDHRKIVVIDGEIAYTGGVNFADEYIHRRVRFGYWKDGGIRIQGDAVDGCIRLFLFNYDLTTFTLLNPALYRPESSAPYPDDGGYYIPFGSGPLPLYRTPVGKEVFLNILAQAERYVYVTTPYLIMDYELTRAFINAACRGVDVRIMTPHTPDKKLVFLLTRSAFAPLIEGGVRIFSYTPGFLHEKLLVSDDRYAIVGTLNLDYRSFAHHFENAVWIYGAPVISDMRNSFLQTQMQAKEVEKHEAKLPLLQSIIRSFIRIFAPLM